MNHLIIKKRKKNKEKLQLNKIVQNADIILCIFGLCKLEVQMKVQLFFMNVKNAHLPFPKITEIILFYL